MNPMSSEARDAYGSLSDVFHADQELRRLGREDALERLLGVVRAHNLQDKVSIRLLHRHHNLGPDEVMVTAPELRDGIFSLVTRPVDTADLGGDVVAGSWQLTPAGYCPSEFVHAPLAADSGVNLDAVSSLFHDLANEIRCLGVADIVGPALSYSTEVESFRSHPDAGLIETTDDFSRESVVQYGSAEEMNSSVQTLWSLGLSGASATTTCKQACAVATNGSGHLGTKTHVKG